MSTDDNQHARHWLAQEPIYPSSPTAPPDTPGEYLVVWRRPHWLPNRSDGRKVFHSYAKADAFRQSLEKAERGRWDSTIADSVFVTIYWRACRPWREVA